MTKNIWIEWVGLWGSGKTTSINSLIKNSMGTKAEYTSSYGIKQSTKLKKIQTLLSISPSQLLSTVKLTLILLPYFFKAHLNGDRIAVSEFRSLLICYLARLEKTGKRAMGVTLWEGELHLLPILGLSERSMNRAVNLILKLNADMVNCIILMNIDEKLAFERVLNDEHIGKNIRFLPNQKFTIDRVIEFNLSQKIMIKCLRESGLIIFESDGNIQNVETFIRSIQ